jgi:hypothetical protein
MHAIGTVAGLLLIALTLVDAFETIVRPRRITRRMGLTWRRNRRWRNR